MPAAAMQTGDISFSSTPPAQTPRRDKPAGRSFTRPAALLTAGLILLLGTVWGLQISLSKLTGLEQGATTGNLLFIHMILTAFFGANLLFRGRLFVPKFRETGFYLVSAILVNIVPLWLELTIAPHMSAGLLTLISSLSPITTVALVLLLGAEMVRWQRILGVLVGIASAGFVIVPQVTIGATGGFWIISALSLPVVAAIYGVFVKFYWPADRTPLQVAGATLAAGTALLLPVHFAASPAPITDIGLDTISMPLLALTLSIAVEFYIYALLVRSSGAVLASCADFIAVFAGFFWGFLIFNERLDPVLWPAVACALAALWLVCYRSRSVNGAVRIISRHPS